MKCLPFRLLRSRSLPTIVALCAAVLIGNAVAHAATLTLLPPAADLPKGVGDINGGVLNTHQITKYVGDKVRYTQDVRCPEAGCNFPKDTKIGRLEFEFAAYEGHRLPYTENGLPKRGDDTTKPPTIGGAAILGGFIFDDGFMLKDGWKLRWLQVFSESVPGAAVVRKVDGNPFYPDLKRKGFDALLYDAPYDLLTRDITLLFQSALVCVDCGDTNTVKWIGSFLWGYTIAKGAVTGLSPMLWGPPTQTFLDTVKADFPDLKLSAGCCVQVVPLPAGMPLMLFATAAIGWVATRRGRAAGAMG